jgi:hypothetical protein
MPTRGRSRAVSPAFWAGDKGRAPRLDPRSPAVNLDYWMWTPEIAREMTRRWISEVPSKMV